MCISFVFRTHRCHIVSVPVLHSMSLLLCSFLNNALHIQRRQPVGTWRCNTLPSCTGLLISLSFFSLFRMGHCKSIFHRHPLLWFLLCSFTPAWALHVGDFLLLLVLLSGFPPFPPPSLFPHSWTMERSSPLFSPSPFQATCCSRWLRSTDRSRCS